MIIAVNRTAWVKQKLKIEEQPISAVNYRVNEMIRVPEVRLIGGQGENVGVVAIDEALRMAQEAELDLVEVAPNSDPPVCRIMDFGKFIYERAMKEREAKKGKQYEKSTSRQDKSEPRHVTSKRTEERREAIRHQSRRDRVSARKPHSREKSRSRERRARQRSAEPTHRSRSQGRQAERDRQGRGGRQENRRLPPRREQDVRSRNRGEGQRGRGNRSRSSSKSGERGQNRRRTHTPTQDTVSRDQFDQLTRMVQALADRIDRSDKSR